MKMVTKVVKSNKKNKIKKLNVTHPPTHPPTPKILQGRQALSRETTSFLYIFQGCDKDDSIVNVINGIMAI